MMCRKLVLLGIAVLLNSIPVEATSIQIDDGSKIYNLAVGNDLYDITFRKGTVSDVFAGVDFTTPGYAELAEAVSVALNAYLNLNVGLEDVDICYTPIISCTILTAQDYVADHPTFPPYYPMADAPNINPYNPQLYGSLWAVKDFDRGGGLRATADASGGNFALFTFERAIPLPGTLGLMFLGMLIVRATSLRGRKSSLARNQVTLSVRG